MYSREYDALVKRFTSSVVQSSCAAMMRSELPYAAPRQVVGLLGGSFDPPHRGHVHITKEALKRFGINQVWWLVSPGNPLKERGPAPIERRMIAARALMRHPRVTVTDLERRIGTRYTAETLHALRRLYPRVRFVWLMGADNLTSFHRWDRWQSILETVPVAVIARPGDRLNARMSPAAERFAAARLAAFNSRLLARMSPPAWCFVNVPMIDVSSSRIRAAGDW